MYKCYMGADEEPLTQIPVYTRHKASPVINSAISVIPLLWTIHGRG